MPPTLVLGRSEDYSYINDELLGKVLDWPVLAREIPVSFIDKNVDKRANVS